MARDTAPQCKQCRREGQKLFLKGERCLTDKCGVERRAYPPGDHGRGRQKQSEYRVQLREKQKAKPLLRRAREAVPPLLREGLAPARHHGREPPDAARAPLRQRPRPPRLRRLAAPGPTADPPRPLVHQRPPGRHPQLPGARRRRHRRQGRTAPAEELIRDATELTAQVRPGSRPTMTRSPRRCCASPSVVRSRRPCRSSSSSSCTPSNHDTPEAPRSAHPSARRL